MGGFFAELGALEQRYREQLRRAKDFKGVTRVRMTHAGWLVCNVRVAGELVEVRAPSVEKLALEIARRRAAAESCPRSGVSSGSEA